MRFGIRTVSQAHENKTLEKQCKISSQYPKISILESSRF